MKHEQESDERFYFQVSVDVLVPAAFVIIASLQVPGGFSALDVAFISHLKLNSGTFFFAPDTSDYFL